MDVEDGNVPSCRGFLPPIEKKKRGKGEKKKEKLMEDEFRSSGFLDRFPRREKKKERRKEVSPSPAPIVSPKKKKGGGGTRNVGACYKKRREKEEKEGKASIPNSWICFLLRGKKKEGKEGEADRMSYSYKGGGK